MIYKANRKTMVLFPIVVIYFRKIKWNVYVDLKFQRKTYNYTKKDVRKCERNMVIYGTILISYSLPIFRHLNKS